VPVRHESSWLTASPNTVRAMVVGARRVLLAYRNLLGGPAYNMVLHTELAAGAEPGRHWRLELFPRLGRVAGFEWGTGAFLCETAPEASAAALREALA